MLLGVFNEFGNVLGRQVGRHGEHIRHRGKPRNRRKVPDRVVRQVLGQQRLDRLLPHRRQQQGVPVGRCLRDEVRPDTAAASRLVFHDDRLAQRFRHPIGQQTPHQVWAWA
ncbi:hypothetical protein G6F58_013493 [Rhizopus delemar]|nr:hypothetical protein G6F58_013493 [Rhizopus delemar]